MADIQVNFMHPTDGRTVTVTVDNSMTAQEAISELISNNFIKPSPQGYKLVIKGGAEIQQDQTFTDAGVTENKNTLRIVPATDAGNAKPVRGATIANS